VIEFKNVSKRFGQKQVLNELSFQVRRGEILFLLGRSGVGKSVTLRHLVGLIRPDSGEIFVDGREITQLSEQEFLDVRRKCGMVFQFPALLDSLNVYENVAFGVRALKIRPPQEEREWVLEKLRLVHLPPSVANLMPAQLSFGMQKKVSLARTLAIHPAYLLFDEPTTSLDPVATRVIHELIHSLSRQLHVTSLVISHDMEGALEYADRILVIDKGQIVAGGTPAEMRDEKHPLVRDFLGGSA
jgi:phospholipid/cholesterol/gamma-HCH transport system ATP-binding protein